MSYYFSKTAAMSFEDALTRLEQLLGEEGFGILTRIDVQDVFRAKLDVPFRRYLILGACNPDFAFEALKAEDKVGTMLPCNVVVQETGSGRVEVAAIDPVASMSAIDNGSLRVVSQEVRTRLQRVIDSC
ncbi:DUF302 domain-containing protein [Parvularcula sp. ZS-1/3]|uniref:DUF302 domain-containing protein n=1 Tax=Parvularcula mediterranea TaxID=2732508 RepID=A0A7Y3RP04_9PROT|nr:DUF302 domain-containing protein [Parvularcula mediterranea]NNU17568.1 DUF302 domain-containing protein [Parvularcula mediterranea]